jgi:hypothetical protein
VPDPIAGAAVAAIQRWRTRATAVWWLGARTPAPSGSRLLTGVFDHPGNANFPNLMAEELDLPPFIGRGWLISEVDGGIATLRRDAF